MKFRDIRIEGDLREWMAEHRHFMPHVNLQWVEPSKYGSSVGAPDITVKNGDKQVQVELKVFERTRHGIIYKVRPVQRRFHRHCMRHGSKTALLYTVKYGPINHMVLIRGDKIPLRDRSTHPDSGCPNGVVDCKTIAISSMVEDRTVMINLMYTLFNDDEFWKHKGDGNGK